MLEVGKRYESPRTGTWIEVVERSGGTMKLERSYAPNTAEEGRLTDQDELPLLQILVIAEATDGRSYGAFPPVAIQKLSLPVLAAIGRLRGYRARYV